VTGDESDTHWWGIREDTRQAGHTDDEAARA